MFNLTPSELKKLKTLSTPIKIQDFLDTLTMNFEIGEETAMSPRRVLRSKTAHCMEGALLAATALWLQGRDPLLLDLVASPHDDDHVVALYKENGYWGAISKTNHATLRFRDPIYKTIRELVLSYFHEYIHDDTGKKVLKSYSRPFNMKKFGTSWITSEDELWNITNAIDNVPHFPIVPSQNKRKIRPADTMERKAGTLREWNP